jgi:hypothetical protein
MDLEDEHYLKSHALARRLKGSIALPWPETHKGAFFTRRGPSALFDQIVLEDRHLELE